MPTLDPRVDAYIDRAAPFAQTILRHVRALVHATCPDVVETVKWGMPHFEYHGVLGGMAAFKEHAAFGLWRGPEIVPGGAEEGMGTFGKLASIADLPPDGVLAGYIRKAMELNTSGEKKPRVPKAPKPPAVIPAELLAAVEANPTAKATWDGFPPSHKREYADWIVEAKTAETKQKRIAQAVEWMAEGKSRNWKYQK